MLKIAKIADKGFQIDAGQKALLAKQIAAFWISANQRLSRKHQFENLPEIAGSALIRASRVPWMYSTQSIASEIKPIPTIATVIRDISTAYDVIGPLSRPAARHIRLTNKTKCPYFTKLNYVWQYVSPNVPNQFWFLSHRIWLILWGTYL